MLTCNLFSVVPNPFPYDELPVRLHVRLDNPAAAQAAHGGGRSAARPPLAVRAAPRAATAAAAAPQQRGACLCHTKPLGRRPLAAMPHYALRQRHGASPATQCSGLMFIVSKMPKRCDPGVNRIARVSVR